ncbi:hypothetical protein [Halobellus ordinarius]|uniref:hypothetical protein n=1 Tax=Halobellus ordinarius TaxID=3075120 RepID=UPI00288043FC|nr:hypothetical protein [Halobellus sp. ZY16]
MPVNREMDRFEAGPLRDATELMQPERLASLKQTRLSFARLLIDKMTREEWEIERAEGGYDEHGVGRAVYSIETPDRRFSFCVFSHEAGEGDHTGRIVAEDWDMWGFLCEGEPTEELMESQYEELPKVREGRATSDILIWVRGNRSTRVFDHVVESLAAGHQPDIDRLAKGGYLTRSSGYYGNGLNGTKEFKAMDDDHPLSGPYMAQMLTIWMLRIYGFDVAEEMAASRSADAASLDYEIKRYLGTGNSSGIGIIHYVINHPQLIHTWIRAREVALARVKTIEPTTDEIRQFESLLADATRWFREDESETKEFFQSKDLIADGLTRIDERLAAREEAAGEPTLWADLCSWADEALEMETQEVLHSLLLDVYPEVSQGLENTLTIKEQSDIVPGMTLDRLESQILSSYQWALDIDLTEPGTQRYFWYRSIDSEEPRLGIRGEHEYEEYGLPVDIARQVQRLELDLQAFDATDTVAEFLLQHPEHRSIVERVQTVHNLPYAEVRANPLGRDFVPLSLISCLKAIWGIQKAHPKSEGWVRGTFFQGAPLPVDIKHGDESYWLYPEKPQRADTWREN